MQIISETFKEIKNLNLSKLLILAIFVRILIMPFYFHPDIKTYNFQSSFLKNGVFNIYSYLEINKEKLPFKEEFVYFPLTYFFLGGYQTIISPLLGDGFQPWLADASQEAGERTGVYRFLFLLKFPYLILDISIAFLLLKFFKDENQRKQAFAFWLLNPFSIVLIYVFSNVDIFPVFLTVVSLLLASKNKLILSAMILGIAAGFKAYPILFLPLLLLLTKNTRQSLGVAAASLGIFLLSILPFVGSSSFRDAALVSGLTTRMFNGAINIGFGESLMFAVISLSGLFFYKFVSPKKDDINLEVYYFSLLILLYSFIHFHIQWLLWIMPFAVLLLVRRNILKPLIILAIVSFSIPILYMDKFMSVSLLASISPIYNLLPTPALIVQKIYDPVIVQSILHSILLGGSLIIVWELLRGQEV